MNEIVTYHEIPDLNLDLFIQTVDNLAHEVEKSLDENKKVANTLEETTVAKKKASALLEGLKGLLGIDDLHIEADPCDANVINIIADVASLKVRLSLNHAKNNKLFGIKLLNQASGSGVIDTEQIVLLCANLKPPNDLRQALFLLEGAQSLQKAIKMEISELRKQFLVAMKAPHLVAVTLLSGMVVDIRVHMCYPNVPGGVTVENVALAGESSSDDEPGVNTQKWVEIKNLANGQCYRTITELVEFMLFHLA